MQENTKKRILILVDWFSPGYRAGGPIQSCLNVSFALKNDYDIYVLTSDTDFGETKPYRDVKSDQWTNDVETRINVFYMSRKNRNRDTVRRIIHEINADFVYLNHLFSPLFVVYPLWLTYNRQIKGKVVVCPRGALYESALDIKRLKKIPFLKLFRWLGIHKIVRFHATNQREKTAILSYFPDSEVRIADNLPNSRQLPFQPLEKLEGTLKCIFVARVHPIKNLLFFLKILMEVRSEVFLTIVGPLEDQTYWNTCLQTIRQLPVNITVNYIGSVPNLHLHQHIVSNHLFVSSTTGENFGHAIFEAFLAGRPVLISDQTPWQKLQTSGVGWEISLAESREFVKAVELAASWDQKTFDNYARESWNFASRFIADPSLKEQYELLFS
jgi:glycosyltransferase involved in cell wall biosynthesis